MWAIGIALIILGAVYFILGPFSLDETLKIGVVAPLSGETTDIGTDMQRSYDLAAAQINESGGVNGHTIEFVYVDGACSAEEATARAQELVETHGVSYVLGGGCLVEADALATYAKESGVLYLSPTILSPMEESSLNVYSLYPTKAQETDLVVAHAKEAGLDRMAVLYEESEYAQMYIDGLTAAYGDDVITAYLFDSETDMTELMATVRTENPNAVYILPSSGETGLPVLEALSASFLNVGVYGSTELIMIQMTEETLSLYEEMVVTAVQLPGSSKTTMYLETYLELYETLPTDPIVGAAAYDSVYLLAEAIENGGDDVAGYMSSQINAWNGALGTFSFDENGNTDLESSLLQVTGGQLIRLNEPVEEVEEVIEESEEVGEEVGEETEDSEDSDVEGEVEDEAQK